MTQEHPITPPPELVSQQWRKPVIGGDSSEFAQEFATFFAHWGAAQELDACCEWVNDDLAYDVADRLRAARRPKPPSLKEQALDELQLSFGRGYLKKEGADAIRRALESLPD